MPVLQAVLYHPTIVMVRQTKKVSATTKDLQKQCKCLACKLPFKPGEKRKRLMHVSCFKAAREAILAGTTTEVELMRKGLMGPKGKSGPKPKNPFVQRLSEGKL
jgi:hypothetical protein